MTDPIDLSPTAAAERAATPQAAAPTSVAAVDPKVIAAILGGATSDPVNENFSTLVAAAREQLNAAAWTGGASSDGEEFIVNASAPIVANELTAVIDHADEQIKHWQAKKDAAKDVLKAAMLAEIQRTYGTDEDAAPKKVTFKINDVTAATWNQSAPSRQLDTDAIKQKYPDVEKNAFFWRTVPGSRRLLLK